MNTIHIRLTCEKTRRLIRLGKTKVLSKKKLADVEDHVTHCPECAQFTLHTIPKS